MNPQKVLTLKTSGEGSPVNRLMDELRDVIAKPEYDLVMVCSLVGVLEMLKLECIEKIKGD